MRTDRILAGGACVLVLVAARWSARGGCAPQEIAQLVASDAAAGDGFGLALAQAGETLVIGAYRKNLTEMTDAGAVYVFSRSGATWSEQGRMTAWDAATGAEFGYAVALSGDTLVVGAPWASSGGKAAYCGAAYVYVWRGGAWIPQQKLLAADGVIYDEFGAAVAVDGDTIVCGARQANAGAGQSGAAYVFARSGSTWIQQAKLSASDPGAADRFGSAVAVADESIVVSAVRAGYNDAGAAYCFSLVNGVWAYQGWLTNDGQPDYDYFGTAISLAGDTLIVTAPGSRTGAAFVCAGLHWSRTGKLVPGAATSCGDAIARDGDLAIMGASGDDHVGGTNAGAAFVFLRAGDRWYEQAKLIASDAAANDRFGRSVALGDGAAVIGAWMQDLPGAADAGCAYVFDLGCSFACGDLDGSGVVDADDLTPFSGCLLGPWLSSPTGCARADLDDDADVDLADYGTLQLSCNPEP